MRGRLLVGRMGTGSHGGVGEGELAQVVGGAERGEVLMVEPRSD